jgi:hypothetical protein
MDGDDSLWRTLALLYGVVLAAAVCVPPAAAVPVLLGIDSPFVLVFSGCLGLLLTGAVVSLLLARFDARVAPPASSLSSPSSPRPTDAPRRSEPGTGK